MEEKLLKKGRRKNAKIKKKHEEKKQQLKEKREKQNELKKGVAGNAEKTLENGHNGG